MGRRPRGFDRWADQHDEDELAALVGLALTAIAAAAVGLVLVRWFVGRGIF